MKDGFIKVACATPRMKVADVNYNVNEIIGLIEEAENKRIKILVFPELSITGYSVQDLFYQSVLELSAKNGLLRIAESTENKKMLVFVGLPFNANGKLYDTVAVIANGKVIALIPKTYLASNNGLDEKRYFNSAPSCVTEIKFNGETIPFGTDIVFESNSLNSMRIAVEIGDELFAYNPPSVSHVQNVNANVIINLSASCEYIGKSEYRKRYVEMHSSKLAVAYVYANAGVGESTTDMVYSGHNIICENGKILAESKLFDVGITAITEIDCNLLERERIIRGKENVNATNVYKKVNVELEEEETLITRKYAEKPFVPLFDGERKQRAEFVLSLQAQALAKRLVHTNASCAVIGISGGLDSALALLCAVRAKEILPDKQKGEFKIYGITMPCFGTTNRTLLNAKKLIKALGAVTVEISIRESVERHFIDIGQPKGVYDVTYENAQARERTQVLMDYANARNGMVIGTGDLSELALGWATYNGDHMSMYSVNASIPKTLVQYLVRYEAERCGGDIYKTLSDILNTPISPELLPTDGKDIVQVTEDKVGPYELHDFFLYYFIRYAFVPQKIYRIAKLTFKGKYEDEVIKKWLRVFLRRFFTQQFKRSCVPDGVKIGSVALSPRGEWFMPSDACATEWLDLLND